MSCRAWSAWPTGLRRDGHKAAGIEINVNVTPAESYWDDVWLKKPLLTSAWYMRPAGEAFAYAYRSGSDSNETHWKRQDYDDLLTQAGATTRPPNAPNSTRPPASSWRMRAA